ncbi:MAG: oligomeric, coiled-coil, peripheral membrane protein [Bathelium mastoideum]|nr:MAG: oligomeric, coiled-coil, peripheral membrane protein [Bathelium mastoideum]
MSLQVLAAHTGERVSADPTSFSSLEAFKSWVAKAIGVSAQAQILLTAKGKHIRQPALLTEKEIFVFDRALLSPSSANGSSGLKAPAVAVPAPFSPQGPPDTITNQNDIQSWQKLFRARRDWASTIVQKCSSMSNSALKFKEETNIVERGLGVAALSLESHVRNAENKLAEASAYYDEVVRDQEQYVDTWEADLGRLGTIPAKVEFLSLLASKNPSQTRRRSSGANITLQNFVDSKEIANAASVAHSTSQGFGDQVEKMGNLVNTIQTESAELFASVEKMQQHSPLDDSQTSSRLFEEVQLIAKKVTSDCDHVNGLDASPKSVAQASKMALLHTRNYLPALKDHGAEMFDHVRRAVEQKNCAMADATHHMQTITSIESMLASAYSHISNLNPPPEADDAFNALGLVSRLPFIYGSLLIEAVRRHEWVDKMKKDSSALAEEMAGYQEEEERRRKKWLKGIGDLVSPEALSSKALGVEINLQAEDEPWPSVSRQDIQHYVNHLINIDGSEAVVKDLMQVVQEMDRPTRKQVKRAKNFKNGSVHEAAFGSTSLMLRGEDEMRVLRDANLKLEGELKGQKSRVRKLEDLLHRQSQMSRLSSNVSDFQPQHGPVQEPSTPEQIPVAQSPRLADNVSRRSSISSRRFSSNQNAEEKALARRIVTLEAEFIAEKERRSALEKETQHHRDAAEDLRNQTESLRTQANDANSTKRDLMENMDAQQREFADERRLLEDELGRHKIRIEEFEDELERLLGSRDNEKVGTDSRIRALEAELNSAKREAVEAVSKVDADLSALRSELDHEREKSASLVLQLQQLGDEKLGAQKTCDKLESRIRQYDEREAEHQSSLQAALLFLEPESMWSESPAVTVKTVEDLARRSADHVQELSRAIVEALSHNETLRTSSESDRNRITSLDNQLAEKESELEKTREESVKYQTRVSSLATELQENRSHLNDLRSKFADGETGSEVLRQRIAEEEARAIRVSSELTDARSHINSLDVALTSLQSRHQKLQDSVSTSQARLDQRTARAKELADQLCTQDEQLIRLLQSLGFIVSHRDGNMSIERAPKSSASSTLSGPGLITRTLSNPPPALDFLPAAEAALVSWLDNTDPDTETSTFLSFTEALSRFSLPALTETLSKRLRDVEHTARKWQKEARSARDRASSLAHEAHSKLALKDFKEGDLALFLPTRNASQGAWAAFNVNAPHYFLRETEAHRLRQREWLVARITRVEERVVDLGRTLAPNNTVPGGAGLLGTGLSGAAAAPDARSSTGSDAAVSSIASADDNPFDLSDGLRWYLIDAAEEKSGAPTTPGLGKSTVASARVDAQGSSVRVGKKGGATGGGLSEASKTLNKSLDSRRSSTNSRRAPSLKGAGSPNETTAAQEGGGVAVAAAAAAAGEAPQNPVIARLRSESQTSMSAPKPSPGLGISTEEATRGAGAGAAGASEEGWKGKALAGVSAPNRSATTSPVKALPSSPSKSKQVSPSKSSPSKSMKTGSPSKPAKARTGIWESLWQLDVSLESGKSKK